MNTTKEDVLVEEHTNLYGPDGQEASLVQAVAMQESAALFLSLGLAYWGEEEDHVDLHLADDGTVVLTVYKDGHAETPLPLPGD